MAFLFVSGLNKTSTEKLIYLLSQDQISVDLALQLLLSLTSEMGEVSSANILHIDAIPSGR